MTFGAHKGRHAVNAYSVMETRVVSDCMIVVKLQCHVSLKDAQWVNLFGRKTDDELSGNIGG